MKKLPKLRRYITISLGLVSLIMIGAYTLLVVHSIFTGIYDAASYDLHLAARDFENLYKIDPKAPLPEDARLNAYMGEENLPVWFKEHYVPELFKHGETEFEEVDAREFGENEDFFLMAFAYDLFDGKRLYLLKIYTDADEIPGVFMASDRAETLVLVFGIGFILIILFLVQLLFCKITASVEVLSHWSSGLDGEQLEQPRPDFKFREIDQLANLIQNGVSDLHQALAREHLFLRNSSHEMRTPIAILRSNMDLLERLRPDPDDREKAIYQRLRRAVDNMHRLTETLLWLSRKEEKMPTPETVDIQKMVEELILENQYLLTGKNVDLSLDIIPVSIIIPRAACRIALVNLIRNAFQYTSHGKIKIKVSQTRIIITNVDQTTGKIAQGAEDYGFGLGLALVEQISRKLGLCYENKAIEGGHRAILYFNQ